MQSADAQPIGSSAAALGEKRRTRRYAATSKPQTIATTSMGARVRRMTEVAWRTRRARMPATTSNNKTVAVPDAG
jgi:hypothetical protein